MGRHILFQTGIRRLGSKERGFFYRYPGTGEKYRVRKEREKFERVLRFSDALPEMRRITSNHLRHRYLDREKVLATMRRLMNAAYFRVGEERYARKNRTYGIATLRRKHLTIQGNAMIFEYMGV
jgi:DNA topoisomerase I